MARNDTKSQELTRKKDFLHLVLSYAMKPEADGDVDFQSLRGLFCHMNQQALLLDKHGNELGEVVWRSEWRIIYYHGNFFVRMWEAHVLILLLLFNKWPCG